MVALHRPTVHDASLVDPALHSPALLDLLEIKLSRPIIEYVVDCTADTVNYAMGRPSSSKRGRSIALLTRAEVSIPTLLVTLVYINRAKPHLQIALEEWACERVFLGALVTANKYLNDSTLKNVQWAYCTGVFGKRDVGRIEREFLQVLDFELSISEDDILSHHDSATSTTQPLYYQGDDNATCPDLAPSSPKSSSSGSSLSPRTPEPVVLPLLLDIMRAFPLPSSLPHSHMVTQQSGSSYVHKPRHNPRFAVHPMTQVTA
ncbi:hypothetical protein BKA83DRAFT_4162287 [Pisolithus microcarpus]|nr:hypothetical protein BKA83DRAFT_4162287 [Pisolithus microcarpus]